MTAIRIGSMLEIQPTDYEQPPIFTWRQFHGFRNQVLRVLRKFGSAGPMGEVDLSEEGEDAPHFVGEDVKHPDFFVVDDMWNAHDMHSYVESDARHISSELILTLCEMEKGFPGWYVDLVLGDCRLRIYEDTILTAGRRFGTVRPLSS